MSKFERLFNFLAHEDAVALAHLLQREDFTPEELDRSDHLQMIPLVLAADATDRKAAYAMCTLLLMHG